MSDKEKPARDKYDRPEVVVRTHMQTRRGTPVVIQAHKRKPQRDRGGRV